MNPITRRKMCGNKKRYLNHYQVTEAKKINEMKLGKPMRAYHCPICGAYHLTSKVVD